MFGFLVVGKQDTLTLQLGRVGGSAELRTEPTLNVGKCSSTNSTYTKSFSHLSTWEHSTRRRKRNPQYSQDYPAKCHVKHAEVQHRPLWTNTTHALTPIFHAPPGLGGWVGALVNPVIHSLSEPPPRERSLAVVNCCYAHQTALRHHPFYPSYCPRYVT